MNGQQPSTDEPTSELRMGQAIPWGICLAVILCALLLAAVGVVQTPWSKSATEREAAKLKEQAEKNNAFGSLADRTHARLEWSRLSTQLEKTATVATELLSKRDNYSEQMRSLETSELGRRIATVPEQLAQFDAISEQAVPTRAAIQEIEQNAKEYLKLAKAALTDDSVIIGPSQSVREDASRLAEKIQEHTNHLWRILQALTSLTAGADSTPGAVNLKDALSQRRKSESDSLLARITREREQIREDSQKKQLENERFTEQTVQNAEIERQEAQQRLRAADARAAAENEKQLVREAEEKISAERAHAAKLKQFDRALPEIQTLLSPMISRGRMQLTSNGWTAGEDGPLSLAALKKAKALELNERGMITLGSIFCGPLNRNDRPRAGFPESMTSNETTIRRAQELLVEFGDILVEKGMLRP